MKTYRSLVTSTLLISLTTLMAIDATAQEKHHIAYQTPAENSKYIQQHAIDAGDAKGHQIRILEIKKVLPKDAPVYEGVKAVEEWNRGYSDYVDGNGRNWGYTTIVLENGDKIFGRWDGVSQTIISADGSKKSSSISASTFTGGTGKFQKIRGTFRGSSTFDAGKGINSGQVEGDYWMED